MPTPQARERWVLEEAERIIRTRTENTTEAAVRRGISYTQLLKKIKRGELDTVQWGPTNALRVWLDADA